MKVYHVDDSQDWDLVLDKYREAILNEKYVLSEDIQELIGKGAVLSFRKAVIERKTSFKEDAINFIEVPENDEFNLILKTVSEIYINIHEHKDNDFLILADCPVDNLTGDLTKIHVSHMEGSDETVVEGREKNQDSMDKDSSAFSVKEDENKTAVAQHTETKEEGQVAEESKSMQVLFGNNDQNGSAIIWSPNDTTQLFHTNTGIIGTMGTGKTQFTKSLITQMYREQGKNVEGKPVGILIFDYKGDYNETKTDFVEVTNATIYKPYHLPFNPLALTKSSVFKPLLPMHTANAFKDTLSKAFNLGPKQQNTLLQCILETYRASGIMLANPDTWDEPAPTLYQVYQRYMNDEEIKKGDSLSAALDTLMMFEVFEANPNNTKTLFEILNGVVVIDLSSYDENIQSLVVAITLDLFYSQMQALGSSKMEGNYRQLTKMILVDEADNFMSRDFPSLKKILKEGREFGVGTILSTQSLKHFGSGDDDYAKYILTWVVHNVSDLKNSDIDFVFKTESKSQESSALFNAIKTLEKHHSVVKIGNDKPVYMKDKAFWQLYKELY